MKEAPGRPLRLVRGADGRGALRIGAGVVLSPLELTVHRVDSSSDSIFDRLIVRPAGGDVVGSVQLTIKEQFGHSAPPSAANPWESPYLPSLNSRNDSRVHSPSGVDV